MKARKNESAGGSLRRVILVDTAVFFALLLLFREIVFHILNLHLADRPWDSTSQIIDLCLSVSATVFLMLLVVFVNRGIGRFKAFVTATVIMAVVSAALCYFTYHTGLAASMTRFEAVGGGVFTFKPGYTFTREFRAHEYSKTVEYNIDRNGYRFCPYSDRGGSSSVITVGDSFVFGELLDAGDTLCATLGGELEKTVPGEYNIRNLGVYGLGLASYLQIISHYLEAHEADWIIIGYNPIHDLLPYDTFYALRNIRESFEYKALVAVFGRHTVRRLDHLGNEKILSRLRDTGVDPASFENEFEQLKDLSGSHGVLIIQYGRGDQFIDRVRNEIPGINFVDVTLGDPFRKDNDFVIPYDGHPSGTANRAIAEIVARVIVERANPETNAAGTPRN